jgi:DNA polymerase-3 subunit gamma/tau
VPGKANDEANDAEAGDGEEAAHGEPSDEPAEARVIAVEPEVEVAPEPVAPEPVAPEPVAPDAVEPATAAEASAVAPKPRRVSRSRRVTTP